MEQTSEQSSVAKLLQPVGGLLNGTLHFRPECDEPQISTVIVQAGDISQVWPHLKKTNAASGARMGLSGAGTGLNDQQCLVPAMVEALERYCACTFTPEQFVSASAEELGADALDLDMVPRCSDVELSHPRCPLVAPNKKEPIRWVRSLSLLDGRIIYVPAVMAYLYAGFVTPAERICVPISTGCAGHMTYEQAVLNGILEVVERDAISIVWLQKLSIPRIEIDTLPPLLASYWERYQRGSQELEIIFFDATTGLGIPTVYGLQISPMSKLRTVVSCSTSLDPATAVAKVIRDMAACRVGFRRQRSVPENWDDFNEVSFGATYMADAERASGFDFLTESDRIRPLSQIAGFRNTKDKSALAEILEIFRQKRIDLYAVDLTTDEAVRAGIRVVRILIPQLQPLGFHYRARYLGHPRLYAAPGEMGYRVLEEKELNHWPQPFA
jgi:ribosomal protein S12 methylthiotransferase accessory factor